MAGPLDHSFEQQEILLLKQYADAITANIPSGILLLSPDLKVLKANPAFANISELIPGDPEGKSLDSVLPVAGLSDWITSALTQAGSQPLRLDRTEWLGETRLQIMVIGLSQPRRAAGPILIVNDVTKNHQAETIQEKISAILETSSDLIAHADAAGRLLRINGGGRELLGIRLDENLSNLSLSDYLPDWAKSFVLNVGLPAAQSNGIWAGETVLSNRSGQHTPVSLLILTHPASDQKQTQFTIFARDLSERRPQSAVLEYQALHDGLTGFPNRTLFRDRLEQAIVTCRHENKPLAVILMDLNHFKEINEALGHLIGDKLLQEVGIRLRKVLWEFDTVARLGGDEFSVILPMADKNGAAAAVLKILLELQAPFTLNGHTLNVGTSIGIAVFPDHGKDADGLMRSAEVAMYAAKQAETDYAIYDPEHDPHSPHRLTLIAELQQAIELKSLILHYQPKLDLKTRRVVGVEALVRWNHPKFGMVPPDQFIPLAEQTGLIKPLTHRILSDALHQCRAWRQAGKPLTVAVNLSARNMQDLALIDRVASLLQDLQLPPDALELEITESAIMVDSPRSKEILKRLSTMGVRISIDDFGTGYSSLAYLKKLPVSEIKIDRTFVSGAASNPDDMVIIRSTIDLGHNLSLKVVAEGVEDAETLDRLVTLGCDTAQGYFISAPLPPEKLEQWLSKRADQPKG